MKTAVIYQSRYGSAERIAGMVAGRLGCVCYDVLKLDSLPDADFYVIGSGIYANRFLPEMEAFIEKYKSRLAGCCALFGAAMRTDNAEKVLGRYGVSRHFTLLHGCMDFETLNTDDREKLARYYKARGLTEAETADKKTRRDLVSPGECLEYADNLLKLLS